MKENIYKKTEYYLYNYKNIDNIIMNIREDIIDSINVGKKAHLSNSNSLEEQAIKLTDNIKIKNLKKAKFVIENSMEIFRNRNIKRYEFIKMKYFERCSPIEIMSKLGYSEKQQMDITNMVVLFFYRQFKKSEIGGI